MLSRQATVERLERRLLLAITPEEYASIRSDYQEFMLPDDLGQINAIEIPETELTPAALQAAVAAAGANEADDLIVLRTTDELHTIQYASATDQIRIEVPQTQGSVTIVSRGPKPLTIDAAKLSTVVYIGVSRANLGGLVISRGLTPQLSPYLRAGGGIYTVGEVILKNLTVTANTASDTGGGIARMWGNLKVYDSKIEGNSSLTSNSHGGGLCSYPDGTLEMQRVSIANNRAVFGGGIYLAQTTSVLTDVLIESNAATSDTQPPMGGGIYQASGSLVMQRSSVVANSTLSKGNTSFGGGVYTTGTASLTDVIIAENWSWLGGGVYGSSSSSLELTNCLVTGNAAQPSLFATTNGGGLYIGGAARLFNTTVFGNSASGGGSGLVISSSSAVELHNNIIAGNRFLKGGDMSVGATVTTVTGSHNLIGNGTGQAAFIDGTDGNLVGTSAAPISPGFVSMAGADGDGWDLRLRPDSPAIDAGDSSLVPQGLKNDLAGALRMSGANVDLGAYEFAGTPTAPVSKTNTAPTATSFTQFSVDGATIRFAARHFVDAFSDAEGGLLQSITITELPQFGTLTLPSGAVRTGQVVPFAALATMKYEPAGAFVLSEQFSFTASDGSLSSAVATVTIVGVASDRSLGAPRALSDAYGYPITRQQSVALADVNGDGYLDIGFGAGNILLGDGSGGFEPVAVGTADSAGIEFADFDDDGILDLAYVMAGSSQSLYVKMGTGDGTFTFAGSYKVGPFWTTSNGPARGSMGLAIGDFNSDGLPDITATCSATDAGKGIRYGGVGVFLNQGGGQFAQMAEVGRGGEVSDVETADFNEDGHLDLALSDGRVVFGNGDGTFSGSVVGGSTTTRVVAGDLNADGKQDLVYSFGISSSVSVRLGNGDGTFAPSLSITTVGSAWGAALADFNGDGRVDIAVCAGLLSVLSADGQGYTRLTYLPRTWVGSGLELAAAGDVNGDGRPDVVLAAGGLYLLLNLPGPSVVVSDPVGAASGDVPIHYQLRGESAAPCRVIAEFSTDGGQSWHPATAADGTVTEGLASSVDGEPHTFVWASATDLPGIDRKGTRFRLIPAQADLGAPATTGAFDLTNCINRAPTEIQLSNQAFAENVGPTMVGWFGTIDPNVADRFSYALVDGEGGDDNGSFQVVDGELHTTAMADFEMKAIYSIRVRTTDAAGVPVESVFTINVTDVEEVPTPWEIFGTEGADTVGLVQIGQQYRLVLNGETTYRIVDLVSSITINLLGGDDSITIGGATPVTISGGEGNDTLKGGDGADSIAGGSGNDSIVAMGGNDTIAADAGDDTVYSGMGADSVHLGDGNDVSRTGGDDDAAIGGAGRDVIIGDNGHDLLHGDDDDDTLNGGYGDDSIYGDSGMDRLIGSSGNDILRGGDDRDQLMGGYDNDDLAGDAGDDTLKGGLGNDTLDGGAGTDTLLGEAGDDWIYSADDSARDFIRGDAGSDHLRYDPSDVVLDTIEENVLA